MAFVIALDQGTTSCRAMLFDEKGLARAAVQREFPQHFPQSGWVEHDPVEIWETQRDVALEVLHSAGVGARQLAALGITNQRETVVVWDRDTGTPVCNAIVWQDRRTAPFCKQLEQDGCKELIQRKTGLVIDPYFSGTKFRWILDHVDGARNAAESGKLAFGTVDSWLIWNLTGGALHVTDVSNASRTLLFNIHTLDWDDELLDLVGVPRAALPEVRSTSQVYGETVVGELSGVAIGGAAGDQQSALFGQTCFDAGMAKNTYGTGCFALMNTGSAAPLSEQDLLTTVAWRIGKDTTYAQEGSIFIAGAVVQWLRDGLGLITSAEEVEPLAASVPDNGGLCIVPAFAGLGAPHWDPHARGLIAGVTRGTTAAHFARAALESIAFQVADILDIMRDESGASLPELRVDGGAAANDLLMQFQADVLDVPVVRPKNTESTALGAAYLAGLASGFWKQSDDLRQNVVVDRRFEPAMSRDQAEHLRTQWNRALRRSLAWKE